MPKDPEDTNMPSGDREPILKAVGHKPRMRKIGHQAKKGGKRQIKHPLPLHSILCIHLVGCINEKMTFKQCQHSS